MSSIGRLNETDLHDQLKGFYAAEDGLIEASVNGFIVDVLRGDELIEIQTRHLGKLRRKIEGLPAGRSLRIVYPIAARTRLITMDESGAVRSNRRSPKRGRIESVFRELTSIADLLPRAGVVLEIAFINAVETRLADGKGSWRRRGISIVGRAVEEVLEHRRFADAADYLSLLPPDLEQPFTNLMLADRLGLSYREVQPMTASFRKMGLIEIDGKDGRALVYRRSVGAPPVV